MLTSGLTAGLASLGPTVNLRMGYPSAERGLRRRQIDRHNLSRCQVHRSRRSKLRPVRQVHFNPDLGQHAVGGVLHRTPERVAPGIVAQDQACAATHHVEGLVRGQVGTTPLLAAGRPGLATTFTDRLTAASLATAAVLTSGLTAGLVSFGPASNLRMGYPSVERSLRRG